MIKLKRVRRCTRWTCNYCRRSQEQLQSKISRLICYFSCKYLMLGVFQSRHAHIEALLFACSLRMCHLYFYMCHFSRSYYFPAVQSLIFEKKYLYTRTKICSALAKSGLQSIPLLPFIVWTLIAPRSRYLRDDIYTVTQNKVSHTLQSHLIIDAE